MTQKVREAIFNILQNRIDGIRMLDLFCGSGAVGIEGLSRGVDSVDFVDLNTNVVVRNVRNLGINGKVQIYRKDAGRALSIIQKKQKRYGFIFIGAPYDYTAIGDILRKIDEYCILEENGFLMLEQRRFSVAPDDFKSFQLHKTYTYGQTKISLYECAL